MRIGQVSGEILSVNREKFRGRHILTGASFGE